MNKNKKRYIKTFNEFNEVVSTPPPTSIGNGGIQIIGIPVGPIFRRKKRMFDVDSETFNRFSRGRNRFERWNKFLNLEDGEHMEIRKYIARNPDSIIVLRDACSGVICPIRKRREY